MPGFSDYFDEEELDQNERGASADTEQAAQALEDDLAFDEEMDEAERRFSLASYYKQLARGGVFTDGSEEAQQVDQEVKAFARERMAVLLNLPSVSTPKKVESQFTPDQVQVLVALADRALARKNEPQTPTAPTVNAIAAPPVPVKVSQPTPTLQPLNRAPKPRGALGTATKAPVQSKPAAKKRMKTAKEAKLNEVYLEDGKMKKKTMAEIDGKVKEITMDLTRQTVHPGRIPPPSHQQMEQITAAQSQTQASMGMASAFSVAVKNATIVKGDL